MRKASSPLLKVKPSTKHESTPHLCVGGPMHGRLVAPQGKRVAVRLSNGHLAEYRRAQYPDYTKEPYYEWWGPTQ